MKLSLTQILPGYKSVFLTHTVQMKLMNIQLNILAEVMLLNPHGSDETQFIRQNLPVLNYFLTHTVQMKPEITTPNII